MPAVWSPDRAYRYTLWRTGLGGRRRGFVQFIGLNPSTADETSDDATLRRCIGFARRLSYDTLCMTNVFAYRSTDRSVLATLADPVGPENDRWLLRIAAQASRIVACWGADGVLNRRADEVTNLLGQFNLAALEFTKDRQPRHPLYLGYACATGLKRL